MERKEILEKIKSMTPTLFYAPQDLLKFTNECKEILQMIVSLLPERLESTEKSAETGVQLFNLSKKYGIKAAEIKGAAKKLGIKIDSNFSTITDSEVDQIIKFLKGGEQIE